MFSLTVENSFRASHQLSYKNGTREDLHDHQWNLRVRVSAPALDDDGLLVDFHQLNDNIKSITEPISETNLEKIDAFSNKNASAENLAKYIFEQVLKKISSGIILDFVEIEEAPGCWARFSR